MDPRTKSALARALRAKESFEENLFVREARKLGWRTRKLNGIGARAWPDQLVALPRVLVMIEFKRNSEPPNENQRALHDALREMGHAIFVAYTAQEALLWCERRIAEYR